MDAELEQRIVKKASSLFLSHGIRAVTMDQVAVETGISKRTLYEIFEDKDTLVLRTIEYQEKEKSEVEKEVIRTCSNSFERSLKLYEMTLQRLHQINRNYVSDLFRYHPKVVAFFEKMKERNIEKMIAETEEGMQEGYVRPELNSRLLALLLTSQLEMLMTWDEIRNGGFSFTEVFETIVMNYARGVATPKGLALLDEHIKLR